MSRQAEYAHRTVARHSRVYWREPEDISRRLELEANPIKWLKHYHGEAFSRPFETPHITIIESAIKAYQSGGRLAVAAERGIGKSTILWALVEMLALSEKQPFPVCIPWSASSLKRAFKFWKSSLCFNPKLLADYPKICAPFAHSRGVSQRLTATTWDGGPNDGEQTGAQLAIGEGLIVLPSNTGCMGGATINGNPRGLNLPMPDGRVLRPTLALLDDVQDRAVAKSQTQIEETIQIIDGDIAGMGEAGQDLSMVMISNTIEDGDVMSHYLSSEQWESVRIPCVERWPDDWDGGDGKAAKAWAEIVSMAKNGEPYKTKYKQYRNKLCKGFKLSAPNTYQQNKEYPDAEFSVMALYFKMGKEAFHAEKQQKPLKQGTSVYTITTQTIMDKVTDRGAGVVPDTAQSIVAAIDVNYAVGLTWASVAYGAGLSHVIDYGRHDMALSRAMPEQELARMVYEAIISLAKTLAGKPYKINLATFDVRGWNYESAYNLSAVGSRAAGLPIIGCMGFGAKQYKPRYKNEGRKGVFWHDVIDTKRRRYIAYCSDFWREIAQKSWIGSIGSVGSCDLPKGNHREFAEQICREPLLSKVETPLGLRWEYATLPGHHDFGDVMHMAFMLADYIGMGTGGTVTVPKVQHKRNRRRVRHVSI